MEMERSPTAFSRSILIIESYEDIFEDAFNGKYLIDLIKAVWGAEPPYKLLDCGSANGLTLEQFDKLGVEAWGIENNAHIHSKTPEEWRERNLLGDVCKMPFEDEAFDFLYVTCLPHLPEEKIGQAIKELFRVCRVGVVLHGVTTDMTEEVIEDYELFKGLQTFWTFSEWSDAMVCAGFKLAVSDPVCSTRFGASNRRLTRMTGTGIRTRRPCGITSLASHGSNEIPSLSTEKLHAPLNRDLSSANPSR